MKLETFENQLLELKEFHDSIAIRNKSLEDLFGEGSYVNSDIEYHHIDNQLQIIKDDMGDEDETIDWLFWSVINEDEDKMDVEGCIYDATIENVWKLLKGKLKLKDSKITERKESEKPQEAEDDFISDLAVFKKIIDSLYMGK